MLLQGAKKKILKEVIQFYILSTNADYSEFIQALLAYQCGQLDTSKYSGWLVNECITLLEKKGITIHDCIENKDVIQSAIAKEKSHSEGEYYTPEIWCKTGREYLQKLLGDLWGKITIWDASAGTGNLMRTADYPQDKLYLSTLLEEDVGVLKQAYPNANVFQLDFLKEIDYDENNMNFSKTLPESLRKILENNEPILFYMNPPYFVGTSTNTDVGSYMYNKGMGKCASDVQYQFLYRILMLKRMYKLTNVYIAVFGSIAFLRSGVIADIRNEMRQDFTFAGGMYFPASEFTNTVATIPWVVAYTMWRPRKEDEDICPDKFRLDARGIIKGKDYSKVVGSFVFGEEQQLLSSWVKAKDVERYTFEPLFTTYNTTNGTLGKRAENAIMQLMSEDTAIWGTRRINFINGTTVDSLDVTQENFDRAIASYTARICYKRILNPYDNNQNYSKPNTSHPDYQKWLHNALIMCVFDWSNYVQSYRDLEVCDEKWTLHNAMFPLSAEEVKSITVDPVILKDLEENPYDNSFVLGKIQEALPDLYPEVKDYYDYCMGIIRESLTTSWRKDINYENNLQTWDASIMQLRRAGAGWSTEREKTYFDKARKVKDILQMGIYTFGFLKHYTDNLENIKEFTFTETDEFDDIEISDRYNEE